MIFAKASAGKVSSNCWPAFGGCIDRQCKDGFYRGRYLESQCMQDIRSPRRHVLKAQAKASCCKKSKPLASIKVRLLYKHIGFWASKKHTLQKMIQRDGPGHPIQSKHDERLTVNEMTLGKYHTRRNDPGKMTAHAWLEELTHLPERLRLSAVCLNIRQNDFFDKSVILNFNSHCLKLRWMRDLI